MTFTPWSFRAAGKITVTPTIADATVYVQTSAGTLHALRCATGERLWARKLDAPPASAPIVVDGVVLVNLGPGKYGQGTAMVALDAATGEVRWADSHRGFFGTAAANDHGLVFVAAPIGSAFTTLWAIDAATGDTAWRSDLEALEKKRGGGRYSDIFSISTPVSSTGDHVLVHLSTSVCYCLDARDGTVVWRTPHDSYYDSRSSPAVYDGVAYLGTGDGGLVGMAVDGGEIHYAGRPSWEELHSAVGWEDPARRSPVVDRGPIVVADAIFFGTRNGFLCRYRPADNELIPVSNLAAGWGAPKLVSAGHRVLALWPRGRLGAFDAHQDTPEWKTRGRGTSDLAATAELFYYGQGRTLIARSTATGRGPRWSMR